MQSETPVVGLVLSTHPLEEVIREVTVLPVTVEEEDVTVVPEAAVVVTGNGT